MERLAECEPVLLGDLREEYRAGRSRWWYWREALSVVGWSLVGAIRSHPVTFFRAIVALMIAHWVAGFLLSALPLESLLYVMPGRIYMRYQVYTLAGILLSFPTCAIATWSIARLHPEVRVPATLVLVVWSALNAMGDAELRRLRGNMPDPSFVPYFLRRILGILVWLAAMVVGGMFVPVRGRGSAERKNVRGLTTGK
jgi:hypothetical protein